jgi:1-acyl-sn-glycerol-3-phosphate acyltransferase
MPDRRTSDAEPAAGVTVELSVADIEAAARLPEVRTSAGEHLPGLEPERRVTDWGRSERLEGLVDRTLYDFLYRYWFRVDVEHVENVPAQGGALLVANHSGVVPSDGAMIAKAVREEHARRRSLHISTERQFVGTPGVGMLVTKLGGVSAHPANLHRLLHDEQQLVLLFPEGQPAAGKALKDRYRLRDFRSDAFIATAIRAGVPIVPVAVVGAEEALPVLGRLGGRLARPLGRVTRIGRLPLGAPAPLPAKFRIRFLEPVATDELEPDSAADEHLLQAISSDVRALIQENLFELVAARRSVWLG